MSTLDADALRTHVQRLVHFDTQRTVAGLDLTVAAIFQPAGAGRLDFGGSEFEAAVREAIAPQKAHPDDAYGWWHLEPGTYIIRYNEALALADGQHAPMGSMLSSHRSNGWYRPGRRIRPLQRTARATRWKPCSRWGRQAAT